MSSGFTLNSAGVVTNEIDLSQPSEQTPRGVPAGVIGTSDLGPAFVPLTFGDPISFKSVFGNCESEKFGPIAVTQWLNSANSCTFLRVLGVGDGKQRLSNGNVKNAGFTVGSRLVQSNGNLGDNPFANSGGGSTEGRTYFLGCFMSESAGSTIFSDAGIQKNVASTNAFAAFHAVQYLTGAIVLKNTAGTEKTYHFGSGTNGTVAGAVGTSLPAGIFVKTNGVSANAIATNFIDVISASNMTGGTKNNLAHFTQSLAGVEGNTTITYSADGITGVTAAAKVTGIGRDSVFLSGSSGGQAVPILRAVILAASGVILHLSGVDKTSVAPDKSLTAATNSTKYPFGRQGALTGSLNTGTDEFVLLINGLKNADAPTAITASFNSGRDSYIPDRLNTDIDQLESTGHYLYAHYDIYPDLAHVTGSGAVKQGVYSGGKSDNTFEDIALLLTSSVRRGLANSGTQVDYESFNDRFSTAKSPFVISQKFGNDPINLFRFHALSDGSGVSSQFKISIENMEPPTTSKPYGQFEVVVRSLHDTDEALDVLDNFPACNLDPTSNNYIARVIGDQNIKYNFDVPSNAQKLVVEGTHPVQNNYIRVEMSNEVNEASAPAEIMPMGFRGPEHLLTSGSLLSNETDSRTYNVSTAVRSLVEPPIPYRENVSKLVSGIASAQANLFWGVQTNRKEVAAQPNSIATTDLSFSNAFVKHFPNHRNDTLNFSVGNNAGVADVDGSVLDSDRFNNNLFSLENIRVRTGSNGKADPDQWAEATYIRNGDISIDDTNKRRAFQLSDLDMQANRSYAQFTFTLKDGFDGTNIFNADKRNLTNNAVKREMDDPSSDGVNDNTVAAYRKAVDILGSKTDVDIQALAVPGIRHSSVTDFAIQTTEDRFDAIYIMDIEQRDQYNTIITASDEMTTFHVRNTVTAFKNRALNTSFAAAYFPDVTMMNPDSPGKSVTVPPSVAVLGTYALNDRLGQPWFAPAGVTRGALNGIEPAVRFNQSNLDDLYEADINPIHTHTNYGTLVFGQKTLLASNSALDRVNVRRLLIDVRRRVKRVANALLFEPNRAETLERFNSLVNPELQFVLEKGGIDRYKVIIDTTTTTQADIENNTIRGKIFLQPRRSIEFVTLDFEVTNNID